MTPLAVSLALAALAFTHVIDGRALDFEGAPLAGVKVSVSALPDRPEGMGYRLVTDSLSGADGGFELVLPDGWVKADGVVRDLSVIAWKKGHGVFQALWEPDDVPAGVLFEPRLPGAAAGAYSVRDELGAPFVGARVTPTALSYPDVARQEVAPEAWAGLPELITDDKGRVELPVAPEDVKALEVELASGARYELSWAPGKSGLIPTDLTLERPSPQVVGLEGVGEVDLSVVVQGWSAEPLLAERGLLCQFFDEVELTGAGPWEVMAPPRALMMKPKSADQSALGFVLVGPGRQHEGNPAHPWELRPAAELSRVQASAFMGGDRAPAPGTRFHLTDPSHVWIEVDDAGQVEVPFEGDFVIYRSVEPPAGMTYRGQVLQSVRPAERGGSVDFKPVSVFDGRVRGTVVDSGGQPVEGAWVVAAESSDSRKFRSLMASTDADGAFELAAMVTNVPYELRAHKGSMAARLVVEAGDDVEVLLEPAPEATVHLPWTGQGTPPRVRLQLVGEDALRFSNAEGTLVTAGTRDQIARLGETVTFARPLEEGRTYAIRYRGVGVEGERRVRPGSTEFVAAGELAKGFALEVGLGWEASGAVRLREGAKAGEVRVRLRSSPPWVSVAEDGSFSTPGGDFDTDIFLVERGGVIEEAALRTNLRTGSIGGSDTEPLMDMESALGEPAGRAFRAESVKALAWPKVEAALETSSQDVMAWLGPLMDADPDGVLAFLDSGRWSDESESSRALGILARTLAEERPRDALAIAQRPDARSSLDSITYVVAPYLGREEALSALAQAMATVPQEEAPSDAVLRAALVGKRLLQLGEMESAKRVLNKAMEAAAEVQSSEETEFSIRKLGEAACVIDETRGLELIQGGDRWRDADRSLSHAVAEAALHDDDLAERLAQVLLKRTSGRFYLEAALPPMAYRMAQRDPERAWAAMERFAETAIPFGLIALAAMEAGDAEGAQEALGRAFDRLDADVGAKRWDWGHPIYVGACLLAVAEAVDPLGIEAWQRRALALPRVMRSDSANGAAWLAEAEACLAVVLAGGEGHGALGMGRRVMRPWLEALGGEGEMARAAEQAGDMIASAAGVLYGVDTDGVVGAVIGRRRTRLLQKAAIASARGHLAAGRQLSHFFDVRTFWWPGDLLR